ncbi:MAG: aminotransferase class IV [Desulfobacterales bacterium]|nr:aminotransferase class IV [Desulfobacterales bacterium]
MIAYYNGRYLPKAEIAISPDDRGFLFADGLYEVIRSYDGRLFQMAAHLERLRRGSLHLRLNTNGCGDLEAVCQTLLEKNNLTSGGALVYIQVTRGAPPIRAHHFPAATTPLTVYATVRAFEPPAETHADGMSVALLPDQRWARCDMKTVGLTANALAAQQAHEMGAAEALLVRDGCVMEGSHSSFLVVDNGEVVAPPLTNYILDSISRQVVETICAREQIPFAARPIYQDRLNAADELMLTGTTLEVTPVTEIKGIDRQWAPGPVTRRLQAAFRNET